MTQTSECQQQGILRQRCEDAVKAIEEVMATPARDRHQVVDFGECAIVRLRDCLIEQYRRAENPVEQAKLKTELDQVNVSLSLITGVEYPGAGIQEKPMQMALDLLKTLIF